MKEKKGHTGFRLKTKCKHVFVGVIVCFALILTSIISISSNMRSGDSYAEAVVCNTSTMRISEAVCLQDMNIYVKQSMEIGVEYELMDERDDSTYKIAKLADGNVWLLDNLRIGGGTEMLLTNDDTNTDPELITLILNRLFILEIVIVS